MAKPFARLVSLLTPKRRWAQFSLGTMLAVVTALGVWLGLLTRSANRQREAVAAIKALGGLVSYHKRDEDTGEALHAAFLRRWLPRDYFDEVHGVALGGTQFTDAGLAHLHAMTRLEMLFLDGTQVTDAGLVHVQGLTGLRWLGLNGTQVTDVGLARLRGLTRLKYLFLSDTQVTSAGKTRLRQALPNCAIMPR